jgi:hypothetical protein
MIMKTQMATMITMGIALIKVITQSGTSCFIFRPFPSVLTTQE